MDPRAPYRSGSIVISRIINIFPRNVTSLLLLFPYFASLRVYIVKTNQLIQIYIKITNKRSKLTNVKVNLSNTWQHLRGTEVQLHSFLTSALDGCEWSASRPGRFTYTKEPQYPFNRRPRGPQSADLDFQNERKKNLSPLPGFEPRFVQPGTKNSTKNRVLRSFSVSSEILTEVSVNVTLLWEMTPCSFADKNVSAKPVASIIKVGV